MTFGFEFFQQFNRTDFARFVRSDTVARVFQHRQRVQRDIRTAPCVRCRREVVCIGFTVDFEDGNSDFFWNFGTRSKPFGICPRLQYFLRVFIAFFGFFLNIVERVEHQQSVFQTICSNRRKFVVVQEFDECMNVVTAKHGTQQFGRIFGGNQRAGCAAFGNGSQK